MKIVDRGRIRNSNIVGFPFIPFGHKSEIRSFKADDKFHIGGLWGGGMCVGVKLEISRWGGWVRSPKSESPMCGWSRGIKAADSAFWSFRE
ncbi:hypothetical protein AVEN_74435-1 [Araneus ventricosus]|uniref:Uncharacterized protein n=1 Tax=Araneus ventricosus TaxID=182803 RepID=A0A4Y2VHI6_ARAVE|nr:hypothetical protein AVEN_74435-1 [Araneus ventricosus]